MPVQLVSGMQLITLNLWHVFCVPHVLPVAHGRELFLSHLLFGSDCLLTQGNFMRPHSSCATVVSKGAKQEP